MTNVHKGQLIFIHRHWTYWLRLGDVQNDVSTERDKLSYKIDICMLICRSGRCGKHTDKMPGLGLTPKQARQVAIIIQHTTRTIHLVVLKLVLWVLICWLFLLWPFNCVRDKAHRGHRFLYDVKSIKHKCWLWWVDCVHCNCYLKKYS